MNKTQVMILIVISLLAILVLVVKNQKKTTSEPEKEMSLSTNTQVIEPKFSAWLWKDVSKYTEEEITNLVLESKKRQIRRIYVNVEEYILILESDNTEAQKQVLINNYESKLSLFIKIANENGITIMAMAGGTLWAFDSHIYIPKTLVAFVNEFNTKHEANKFEGLQFDVEYYNSDIYKDAGANEKVKLSREYLNFVQTINSQAQLPIGFAIPYWFDRNDAQMTFTYSGVKASLFEHLLKLIGKQEDEDKNTYNHLAIMSYRRKTEGNNSTIEIVKNLFKLVETSDRKVLLLIGQDTATEDTSMSFLKNENKEFLNAAVTINKQYGKYDFYDGVAVHHLTDYLLMTD